MKNLIAVIMLIAVVGCLGCDYQEVAENYINEHQKKEECYTSTDGSITIIINYEDYEDLESKYSKFGEVIEWFVLDLEYIINKKNEGYEEEIENSNTTVFYGN